MQGRNSWNNKTLAQKLLSFAFFSMAASSALPGSLAHKQNGNDNQDDNVNHGGGGIFDAHGELLREPVYATISNSGTIQSTNPGGRQINVITNTAIPLVLQNTGTIQSTKSGSPLLSESQIHALKKATYSTISNSGTIQSTNPGGKKLNIHREVRQIFHTGNIDALKELAYPTISNSGTIQSTNSGSPLLSESQIHALTTSNTPILTNRGTVQSTNSGSPIYAHKTHHTGDIFALQTDQQSCTEQNLRLKIAQLEHEQVTKTMEKSEQALKQAEKKALQCQKQEVRQQNHISRIEKQGPLNNGR